MLENNIIPISENEIEVIRSNLKRVFEHRKQAMIYTLARKIFPLVEREEILRSNLESEKLEDLWIDIASLSQLRVVVGGRFKNLKEKWIKAGFPLREHRGDRNANAEIINEAAWTALALWINKQGFDAQLGETSDPWLFRVKNRAKNLK